MQWATPEYGWLLLLLIPACITARLARQKRRHHLERLGYGDESRKLLSSPARNFFRIAAFLLLVMALCRPQWGTQIEQPETQGIDILIALDTSRSMLADDLSPNRLAAAKKAITSLTERLQGDRIGLVPFAGSAFLVCPLTSDYAAFRQAVEETGSDTIPRGGSDLSSIEKELRNGFDGTKVQSRLLILMSDGEDHAGSAAEAAARLRASGMMIGSVTVGSDKGGIIVLPDGNFLKDRTGNIVRSRAHPETLELFSERNVRLDASGDTLVRFYEEVRPSLLQRSVKNSRQRQIERFQIPLGAALFLLAIETFFIGRRRI